MPGGDALLAEPDAATPQGVQVRRIHTAHLPAGAHADPRGANVVDMARWRGGA